MAEWESEEKKEEARVPEKRGSGQPTKYKPEYCQMLIDHMKKGDSFESFAAEIGTGFDSLYNWSNARHDSYQPEFFEARKVGIACLLKYDEAVQKAGISGQLRRVSKESKTVDTEGKETTTREYEGATFAQSAHIFKMKNRYRDLYKDRHEVEHSGPGGGPMEIARLTNEQIKKRTDDLMQTLQAVYGEKFHVEQSQEATDGDGDDAEASS